MAGVARAVFAIPAGLAAYAVASHLALIAGWPLGTWLFPVAVVLGCAAAARLPAPAGPAAAVPGGWRWLPWVVGAALAVACAALVYGAVATPDREWDGLVSWSLRARYLAPPADLGHPVFQDPAVFTHSFAYPALQPLCLGACQALVGELPGRLWFPAVFAAFVGLVAATVRELGLPAHHRQLLVLAFALTPMWYSTGSGAVDSGYGDLLLGYLLAVGAAGLLLGRRLLLFAAALCLPLVKPEGLPYAGLLALAVALGCQGRRCLPATVAGLVSGMALGMAVQARLQNATAGLAAVAAPVLVGGLLVGLQEVRIRCRWRWHAWLCLGVLGAVAVGCSPLLLGDTVLAGTPLLRDFVANIVEVPARLSALPELVLGYLEGLLFVRKYGLLYAILLGLLCIPGAWRVGPAGPPHRALLGLLLAGLGLACLAVLLGDDTDWQHVFRSRFDRLLLHWVGVGWLLLGPWVSDLLGSAAAVGEEAGVPHRRPA